MTRLLEHTSYRVEHSQQHILSDTTKAHQSLTVREAGERHVYYRTTFLSLYAVNMPFYQDTTLSNNDIQLGDLEWKMYVIQQ